MGVRGFEGHWTLPPAIRAQDLPHIPPPTPPQDTPAATTTMVDPITAVAKTAEVNSEVQTNSAPWGNTMPISIGSRAVVGKLIWSSDLREVPQPESGDTDNTQTPKYEVDLAISFGRPGAVPEERGATKLMKLWAQQTLCFSAGSNSLALLFAGMSVTFHPGLVDAMPDATVQADKGDLTPAWRNQMYVVIKNFPLWLVGLTDGLPDFVAEIFDAVESGTVITPYTMKPGLTLTNHLYGDAPLLYNAKKNQAYAFILGPVISLSTFDLDSMTEVHRASFDASYEINPENIGLCVHDPVNNFVLVENGIANTTPKHLINLSTGKVMQTLGKTSTHLGDDILDPDPAQVQMVFKSSGAWFQTRLQGLVFNGMITGSFLGGAIGVVWYASDGSAIQLTAAIDVGPENIHDVCTLNMVARTDLAAQTRQDAFAFVGHGSKVTMIQIGSEYPVPAGHDQSAPLTNKVNFNTNWTWDIANFPGGTVRALFIDPSDRCLVCIWGANDVLNVDYMTKIRLADFPSSVGTIPTGWRPGGFEVLWQILLPHPVHAGVRPCMREGFVTTPIIGLFSFDDNLMEIDSATGAVRRVVPLPGRGGGNGFLYNGLDGAVEYINRGSNVIEHIQLYGASSSPMPLADIITSYLLSAKYDPSQFSIDPSIDDLAYGSMIDQSTDLWSMMQNLGVAYNFKYFISGSQIKFTRPADTSTGAAFTVDLDTLAGNTSEPYDAVQTTFAAPSEAPGNVGITYIDKDQHYVSNTQTFRRTNFPVAVAGDNDTTVPVPIVMRSAEALRRAAVATFAQDAQTEILAFKLPTAYLAAEPVDIIRIQVNGFIYNVLVGEIILDPDWTLSTTGANRIVNANDRFRVGPDGNWISPGGPPFVADPPTPPSLPPSTSPTEPIALDMPLLTPDDNLSNAYLAIMCGADAQVLTGWAGATVSTEVGTDPWGTLFHATQTVPSGQMFDALPATSTPFQTDTSTVITVDPTNFDPSTIPSVTDEEFRAGFNAIVVGDVGRWELIYFQTATVVDATVELSTITRGCRGTELFTDLHAQSDAVYFVSLGGVRQSVRAQGVDAARIDEVFSTRARGNNFSGNITSLQFPIEGQSLKPWAPCAEKAVLGSTINAVGAPDYHNTCGGGTLVSLDPRRTRLINVTANTVGVGGVPENLVNGSILSDTANSFHVGAGLTNLAWTFDFRPSGLPQIITALVYDTQGGASVGGTYTVEASNDAITWTSLTTGIALASAVEYSWANVTGYFYYRVRQDSGTTLDHVGHEFLFKTQSDVTANAVLLTWQRRDRLGTEFITTPLAMSEDSESYDLEIFSDSAIVRTVASLPFPVYLYSEANQATDGFGVPPSQLDVRVYQLGSAVGRGFVREATVTTGA